LMFLEVKARDSNSRFFPGNGSKDHPGQWVLWGSLSLTINLTTKSFSGLFFNKVNVVFSERKTPSLPGVTIWRDKGYRGPSCHVFLEICTILTGIFIEHNKAN
jgi:hypothetical protein